MVFATEKLPCVILAGGRSSRMGSNKALATVGGVPLIAHIVARMTPQSSEVAVNAPLDFEGGEGLRRVPDTLPGQLGPLAGVLAAMRDTEANHPAASHVLTVPTDGPFLPTDLMARLADARHDGQTIAIASSSGEQHLSLPFGRCRWPTNSSAGYFRMESGGCATSSGAIRWPKSSSR